MGAARRAAGPALHVQVLPAARLRRASLRRDRDEPRPAHRLHRAGLVRPRRVLRPGRLRERRTPGARGRLAVAVPPLRRPRRRPLRAGGQLLLHSAPRDLLRVAHADLRRGRVPVLPLHADLRRLGRDPGGPAPAPGRELRDRHADAELLPRPRLPGARVPRVPRARHLALRQGARRDPGERGSRALSRLQRPALQDGRVHDLGAPHRSGRRALSRALGLRDARPHALDGVGRVHHHGHDRRGRGARPPPPRRAAMARDGVVLEVDGVSKSFGALAALSNVSLVVQAGQIFSVIGPNGAGKSTLFNVVSGLHVPSTGRVRLRDREIAGLAPETINRLGVAKTFQITNIFPEISVFETVRVAAQSRVRESGRLPSLWRLPDVEAAAADLLRAFGLAAKRDEMAEHLSHGEQRYLEICLALATEPTLLLLDEPTAGMTPGETKEAMALIRQIASARGLTVLLIEHDMSVVMGISDRIAVLHFGEKIAEGAPEEIRNDPKVVEAYLGPPED